MKIVLLGNRGQLGQELQRSIPANVHITAWDYPEIDLEDTATLVTSLQAEQPNVIINTAAFTAVDLAESESEKAYNINAVAPRRIAEVAHSIGARLIHISTDFVFDGSKSQPYTTTDETNPISIYGASKLGGERGVLDVLGSQGLVVRTSWLYSFHGKNFPLTIIRILKECGCVNVVSDQVGSPTWAYTFAEVLWKFALRPDLHGLWHYCDAGVASWYDFAYAIVEEAHRVGLLSSVGEIIPITTADYPTPARRPSYSVLDASTTRSALGLKPRHWREGLE